VEGLTSRARDVLVLLLPPALLLLLLLGASLAVVVCERARRRARDELIDALRPQAPREPAPAVDTPSALREMGPTPHGAELARQPLCMRRAASG
jgi:hypothetical protein